MSNILSILYRKNDTLDVNYVCIVQNAFLVFYNASSLKQHIMGRHVDISNNMIFFHSTQVCTSW